MSRRCRSIAGRGIIRPACKRAIRVMEADAMDFSLLFTGIHGYYARQGYATLPRKRLRGTLRAGLDAASLDGCTVRSMTS